MQQAHKVKRFSCPVGYADCSSTSSKCNRDHCGTNLLTNVSNCGACGHVCTLANAVPACVSGACAVASCKAGWGNCDGNALNGCETNLGTSAANCGACGHACSFAHAGASCTGGACAIGTCSAGFGNCDGSAANGCEVNLATDLANCGACGKACAPANATGVCTAGACGIASCRSGFADCNGNPADGCEVDLSMDLGNCGACGHACDTANGAGRCQAGVCGISTCNPGFADCNGRFDDGCETRIDGDADNCGGCGHVCSASHAASTCSAGVCGLGVCQVGFGDCDGDAANGCEADFSADANNCSGCGNVCSLPNATSRCNGGACAVAECAAGHADCDGNPANGCEVDTTGDASNCGACGHVCSSHQCAASACVTGCAPGRADCDGNQANGCETDISSDTENCGACGELCAPGAFCGGGVCQF